MRNFNISADTFRLALCVVTLLLIPSSLQISRSIAINKELWQGLGGSLIGAFVTCVTIIVMIHQIRTDNSRHEESRKRRALALRARMPEALNDISRYNNDCFDLLHTNQTNLLPRPISALEVFRSCIEYIETIDAQRIFEAISFFQVHEARLENYLQQTSNRTPSSTNGNFSDRIRDLVELNLLFSNMYPYARGEAETISAQQPTRQDRINSLRALDRYRHQRSRPLEPLF